MRRWGDLIGCPNSSIKNASTFDCYALPPDPSVYPAWLIVLPLEKLVQMVKTVIRSSAVQNEADTLPTQSSPTHVSKDEQHLTVNLVGGTSALQ